MPLVRPPRGYPTFVLQPSRAKRTPPVFLYDRLYACQIGTCIDKRVILLEHAAERINCFVELLERGVDGWCSTHVCHRLVRPSRDSGGLCSKCLQILIDGLRI